MSAGITLRTAAPADAEVLAGIYRPYVEETAISFEYTAPTAEEFRERMARTLERYPYIVAEEAGRILGYAYAGAFIARPAYGWSAETTIYLRREARRRGAGRRLYAALEGALEAMGVRNLYACIGCPRGADDEYLTRNSAEFHAHLGYRLVGEFRGCGYKFGRWYDMVWMEKLIGAAGGEPRPVRPFPQVRPELVPALLES